MRLLIVPAKCGPQKTAAYLQQNASKLQWLQPYNFSTLFNIERTLNIFRWSTTIDTVSAAVKQASKVPKVFENPLWLVWPINSVGYIDFVAHRQDFSCTLSLQEKYDVNVSPVIRMVTDTVVTTSNTLKICN